MKIEFTGTGGTGKTTTALLVAEALGLDLLPSVKPSMRRQIVIFEEHLKQIEKYKDRSYVADHSLVCRLAQALLNSEETLESPELMFLCEATKHSTLSVDLMVYFPTPHWTVKADNFRLNSLRETVALDALTLGFLQSAKIPAMTAFQGTVEDRVLQITTAARLLTAGKRKKPLVEVVRNPMKLG